MPVRSGVTVTDTSHLCRLNALMSLVCMQRATLKVITWSLVREQRVPLQQTLRLKVHPHRLDAIATVASFLFFFLSFYVVIWQRSLMHFLLFWGGFPNLFAKFVSKKRRHVQPYASKWVLAHLASRTVTWWSRPVGNTWRVDSRPQLCAASAETMTIKYTFSPTL